VSSWATSVINADTFGITFGEGAGKALLGFGDDLTLAAIVESGIDSAITAGLSSVVYGTDFGSGFLNSFGNSLVTLATADFQTLIGKQGLKEGGFEHAGLHALVGCVAAELSSANCASGAIGGIAQSIYAGNTGILERHINKDKHLANVEMVSALAAYFTSQGKGENVSIGASIGRSGFENNALCGGLCILAAIAVGGYILGTGEGDPIEGLRRIGRGEDLLSELAGLAGEEALAFATDNFPEETAVVINAMVAAGEAANVVIQWTDEATGHVVSSTWNDIPQSTRDAIVGGTKVATFLIPAGAAGRILRRVPEIPSVPGRVLSRVNLEAGGWDHVVDRHFNPSVNASQFLLSQKELRELLQSPEVVQTPVLRTLESADGIRYVREITFGTVIGLDKFNGFQPTNIMTVLTDSFGNLVSATPGVIK